MRGSEPCMCGDTDCWSCGTAQGTREERGDQLTDEAVAEIEALLAKATPGPWCVEDEHVNNEPGIAIGNGLWWIADLPGDCGDPPRDDANAALIVAAVNALPAVLAERAEAQREIARLRAAVAPIAAIALRDMSRDHLDQITARVRDALGGTDE